jgi:hypothetical protein
MAPDTSTWAWERYERTYWVHENGTARCYFGWFTREFSYINEDGLQCHGFDRAEVRFWATKPIVAMRAICTSGEDPASFADTVVN